MFASDNKMGGKSAELILIKLDLYITAQWIDRNCMLLKATQMLHIHFGRNAFPTLVILDFNAAPVFILQAYFPNHLGILVGSSLSLMAHIDLQRHVCLHQACI